MACPAIITGDEFLLRVINHIDCQAQIIGSYGYQALGQPGSLASTIMAGLLTLFVALFGIRMLFGPPPGARDTVFDVIKIGLVITLAFSWPAFRTVVHDVVLDGPAQIANVIITSGLSETGSAFTERLQRADVTMVRLTETGTGRNVGAVLAGSNTGASFAGTGLQDDAALGYGRLAYLSGVIASFGLLRLIAALLLALAPLAAGLLLFEQTRGIFAGWLRGLTLAMVGTVGMTAVLALQLSILEPWLADALRVRSLGYGIPSAPMELLAINTAFAFVQFAMIWLLAKVAFNRGWITIPQFEPPRSLFRSEVTRPELQSVPVHAANRVQRLSDSVETLVQRERTTQSERTSFRTLATSSNGVSAAPAQSAASTTERQRLGSTFRRASYRGSQAAKKRDGGV